MGWEFAAAAVAAGACRFAVTAAVRRVAPPPPKRRVVQTERAAGYVPRPPVRVNACAECQGRGRRPCRWCAGRGRTNHPELAVLPRGERPAWCARCGARGVQHCAACFGTGERRSFGLHAMGEE